MRILNSNLYIPLKKIMIAFAHGRLRTCFYGERKPANSSC